MYPFFVIDARASVKPVLKWVGGKSKLTKEILSVFPKEFKNYHEPFAGGAAVFFALGHSPSYLYDINKRLMLFYSTLREEPNQLLSAVKGLESEFNALDLPSRKEWFYNARERFNSREDQSVTQSALFLALNKTAFNGIYRENSKGEFNVPYNSAERRVSFVDESNFHAASKSLSTASLIPRGFMEVEKHAKSGDLVYFDPPYVPLSPTSSFTGYHASGFGEVEQIELIQLCARLRDKAVHVVSSNSYSPWVLERYEKEGFEVQPVQVMRGIAAKPGSRGRISEALIVSP
jgi:DNA adenine methylase